MMTVRSDFLSDSVLENMTEADKIEIVIKGGRPWGFHLQKSTQNQSAVVVDQILRGGKADLQGALHVGDHVIRINDVQCLSLSDALQLIESAFRTLTILIWRPNMFTDNSLVQDICYPHSSSSSSTYSTGSPPSECIYENVIDLKSQFDCNNLYVCNRHREDNMANNGNSKMFNRSAPQRPPPPYTSIKKRPSEPNIKNNQRKSRLSDPTSRNAHTKVTADKILESIQKKFNSNSQHPKSPQHIPSSDQNNKKHHAFLSNQSVKSIQQKLGFNQSGKFKVEHKPIIGDPAKQNIHQKFSSDPSKSTHQKFCTDPTLTNIHKKFSSDPIAKSLESKTKFPDLVISPRQENQIHSSHPGKSFKSVRVSDPSVKTVMQKSRASNSSIKSNNYNPRFSDVNSDADMQLEGFPISSADDGISRRFSSSDSVFEKSSNSSSNKKSEFSFPFRLKSFIPDLVNKFRRNKNSDENSKLHKLLDPNCMYPNCHNKFGNCKIHSPPEKDYVNSNRHSVGGGSMSQFYLSLAAHDESNKNSVRHIEPDVNGQVPHSHLPTKFQSENAEKNSKSLTQYISQPHSNQLLNLNSGLTKHALQLHASQYEDSDLDVHVIPKIHKRHASETSCIKKRENIDLPPYRSVKPVTQSIVSCGKQYNSDSCGQNKNGQHTTQALILFENQGKDFIQKGDLQYAAPFINNYDIVNLVPDNHKTSAAQPGIAPTEFQFHNGDSIKHTILQPVTDTLDKSYDSRNYLDQNKSAVHYNSFFDKPFKNIQSSTQERCDIFKNNVSPQVDSQQESIYANSSVIRKMKFEERIHEMENKTRECSDKTSLLKTIKSNSMSSILSTTKFLERRSAFEQNSQPQLQSNYIRNSTNSLFNSADSVTLSQSLEPQSKLLGTKSCSINSLPNNMLNIQPAQMKYLSTKCQSINSLATSVNMPTIFPNYLENRCQSFNSVSLNSNTTDLKLKHGTSKCESASSLPGSVIEKNDSTIPIATASSLKVIAPGPLKATLYKPTTSYSSPAISVNSHLSGPSPYKTPLMLSSLLNSPSPYKSPFRNPTALHSTQNVKMLVNDTIFETDDDQNSSSNIRTMMNKMPSLYSNNAWSKTSKLSLKSVKENVSMAAKNSEPELSNEDLQLAPLQITQPHQFSSHEPLFSSFLPISVEDDDDDNAKESDQLVETLYAQIDTLQVSVTSTQSPIFPQIPRIEIHSPSPNICDQTSESAPIMYLEDNAEMEDVLSNISDSDTTLDIESESENDSSQSEAEIVCLKNEKAPLSEEAKSDSEHFNNINEIIEDQILQPLNHIFESINVEENDRHNDEIQFTNEKIQPITEVLQSAFEEGESSKEIKSSSGAKVNQRQSNDDIMDPDKNIEDVIHESGSLSMEDIQPTNEIENTDTKATEEQKSEIQQDSEIQFSITPIRYDDLTSIEKCSLILPLSSVYFTTSVPKAKLLTQFGINLDKKDQDVAKNIFHDKDKLVESLTKKLDILKSEENVLKQEMNQNEELGENLAENFGMNAQPNELKKFKVHVSELEKITNLRLGLAGRLARTENALQLLPPEISAEQKEMLEAKLDKLKEQHEEALILKGIIDKRNDVVIKGFLTKYMSKEENADYDHYVDMKVKLIVDFWEIKEKIKLGEEQLEALQNMIP